MAKKKSSKRARETNQVDFESSLAEVERIVAMLESGELGLTESLEKYETGIRQLNRCHQLLDAAEQRVSLLSGFDAEGNPVARPMQMTENRDDRGIAVGNNRGRTSPAANAAEGDADARNRGEQNSDNMDDLPGLF